MSENIETPTPEALEAVTSDVDTTQGAPDTPAVTDEEVARDLTQIAERDATGRPVSTRGTTFDAAAAVATPDPVGRLGTSPEAERTGRADKGLSQANPAILTGGPVPDSRLGVDDTAALDALEG